MADKISKKHRSWNMSRIRSKNTKPEILVRKALYNKGYRYRIHYKLPGRPDMVFVSKKIVIFIHGCFWHGHNCKNDHKPKTNKKFWNEKIINNQKRDNRNNNELKKKGWNVIILWECQIKNDLDNSLEIVIKHINKGER